MGSDYIEGMKFLFEVMKRCGVSDNGCTTSWKYQKRHWIVYSKMNFIVCELYLIYALSVT